MWIALLILAAAFAWAALESRSAAYWASMVALAVVGFFIGLVF